MKKNYSKSISKSILLLLALGLFVLSANAQIVNIPDANFKAALASKDTNMDGQIQVSEALAVTSLDFQLVNKNIINLTGIQAFTNLTILDVSANHLVTVNISMLTQLQAFYIDGNGNSLLSLNINNGFTWSSFNNLSTQGNPNLATICTSAASVAYVTSVSNAGASVTNCILANDSFVASSKFSLSPNPAQNSLTITTQEKINTLNIIDLLGRKTNITNFENNKIDVSNLQNGVYFLEIATENGLQTQKFIKN
jgi:hypothetical protein